MDANHLRELYDHHAWANEKVLAEAAQVSAEQLKAAPWEGVMSLGDTLMHVIGAQRFWSARWRGEERPADAHTETVAEVAALWEETSATTREFLTGLDDAALDREIASPARAGPSLTVGSSLTQVLLHSVQHRSEAAALLTEYGHSPGMLDYVVFLAQREA